MTQNKRRHNDPPHDSRLKAILRKVADIVVPMTLSALLVVWLFHKVHPRTILAIVRESCDYGWLLIMCLVLVVSRSVRGVRWGLQLRAAGVKRMPAFAEMVSIFGAYALNLLMTGVGEAWRCIYVARRQKASLSVVIGTDLGDRISDAIMIIALTCLSLGVAHPVIERFMEHYSFGRHVLAIISSPWLWIGVGVLIVAVVSVLCFHTKNKIVLRIRKEISELWGGFKVLFTMKHQVLFWSETLLIWVAYFLMTYLCFFAFPFTRVLVRPELAYGLLPGLVVFIFGSLSIAIPASGGLGPWNLAVMFALSLYGVDNADAVTYSMVVWAFQTVTQVVLGLVSAVYITIHRRDMEKEKVEDLRAPDATSGKREQETESAATSQPAAEEC